jgi:hypothetical protein
MMIFGIVTEQAINMEGSDDDEKNRSPQRWGPKIESSCISLQYDLDLEWQVPDQSI